MLMTSECIGDKHRVYFLAAAAKELSVEKTECDTSKAAGAAIVKHLQCETNASILRQCVRRDIPRHPSDPLNANQGKVGYDTFISRKSERLGRMKNNFACLRCAKFGHWKDEHSNDGTVRPGVPAFDKQKHYTGISGNIKPVDKEYNKGEHKLKVA